MKLSNKMIACMLCVHLCLTVIPCSDTRVSAEPGARSFQHPGILNSAEELQIMKHYAVSENACEPWGSAYEMLEDTVKTYYDPASSSFINMDWLGTTVIVRSNSGGWNDMRVAATKVYNLSGQLVGEYEHSVLTAPDGPLPQGIYVVDGKKISVGR